MKLNWKTSQVVLMLVIAIGTILWTANFVRPQTYSGTNLSFGVGEGIVTLTNPSEEHILSQLTGTGTRSFRFASTVAGVSGSSIRQMNENINTQQFDYTIPPGVSEFAIIRGVNVQFVATTNTMLQAVVNPFNADTLRTTLITAAIIVLAALYYASRITNHRWIGILRGQPVPVAPVIDEAGAGGQGRPARAYGDNHVE